MPPHLGPYALLPDFLEYMIHGDNLMLGAAQKIAPEEYYKERGISIGSLHKLLVHAMGAQWVWLHRFQYKPVAQIPDDKAFPTREALQARWPEVHAALREYVGKLTLEDLQKTITFKNFQGIEYTVPLCDLLLHVTDHGTYHRGQQNTFIKLAGGTPINVFYYQWAAARKQNP